MKHVLAAVGLGVFLSLGACSGRDVTSAEMSDTRTVAGTIRDIDKANRRLVVRTDGAVLTLRATDTLRNFDQLKVGDRIRMNYTEAVALDMALPGEEGTDSAAIAAAAPQGAKPGAAAAEVTSTVVEFLAYDPVDHFSTVRNAKGEIVTVKVPKDLRAFARSRRPGDRILATYGSAVAIGIEPSE